MISPETARGGARTAETGARQILRATRRVFQQPDLRAVLACSVVLGLASSFMMPFLSMFGTREVRMSLAGFGAFMTATVGVNIVLSSSLSKRSDELSSRRSMLLLGAACGALGYVGYAFTRDVWLLLLIGALVLGVASTTFSQLFAHARELLDGSELPASEAPLYMNAFRMCFALSWTVGPALAAATLRRWSFEGLFCGAALLYSLLFLLIFKFVRAPAGVRQPRTPAAGHSAFTLFSNFGRLAWFVAFVLIFASQTMSMSNMSLLVLDVLGGNESQVGTIFSLAPLFELPFMLYFGLLATRTDATKLIYLAMVLAVLYYGALSLVSSARQIYPLQILSAAIVSVTSGVAITFFQNELPNRLGAATNMYANASRLGSTSGYLLFGAIAAGFGHRGTYVACAALAGGGLLLGVVAERFRWNSV